MSAHFTLGFTATFSDLRRPSALVLKSSASLANLRNISFAAVTLYVFTETNERVQKQTWNSKQQPSLGAISSGRLVGHFSLWEIFGTSDIFSRNKAHVQSQWKGANFDPMTSKSLKFFSNLNLTSVITSPRSTLMQVFISVRSAEASLQVDEILRFCDFILASYLVALYFFIVGHAPRSNPWMDFHGLWLIRHVFTKGRSFWGLRQYRNSFAGNSPKNTPQKGAWTGNFKPNRQNIIIAISCTA